MKIPPRSCLLFKPDGLGDFILASGAIRLLADELGEGALTLAVLPLVGPLAAAEFPSAKVEVLPLREKRRMLNLFIRNFLWLFPHWLRLVGRRHQWVASLRHSRTYLHSFFLAALRSDHFAILENQFAQEGGQRDHVESLLWRGRGVHPLPYPKDTTDWPMELEAHVRVVERILQRRVGLEEILPRWQPRAPAGPELLLAPFSSSRMKDYPIEKWAEALRMWAAGVRDGAAAAPRPLRLIGGPEQQEALQSAAGLLRERLATCADLLPSVEVLPPTPLAELPVVLSRAGLVLTVDTVFAHLACALDRPAVIAFSGLHRGIYAPWQRSARQVWLEAEPVPEGQPARKKNRWHEGIPPATVAREIHRVTKT